MFGYYFNLALRSFRRDKALTALMVLAIALGIGASMTTLTVFYVLSGDPVPTRSDQLYYVQMARGVLELLEEINAAGTTIVMVTHDPELAARAQRNVHIVDGMATDLSLEPGLARAPASSADAATSHLA